MKSAVRIPGQRFLGSGLPLSRSRHEQAGTAHCYPMRIVRLRCLSVSSGSPSCPLKTIKSSPTVPEEDFFRCKTKFSYFLRMVRR